MWTVLVRVESVVLLVLSHPQLLRKRHPCTVGVNRDSQVCRDVQGDIMTEHQLVLMRLFAVSLLWLVQNGLVVSFLTFILIVQHTPSAALHGRESRSEDGVRLKVDLITSTQMLVEPVWTRCGTHRSHLRDPCSCRC